MKFKKLLLGLLFFIFTIYSIFIPFNTFIQPSNDSTDYNLNSSQSTSNTVDYIIDDNTLFNSQNSNITNINLRHNNIITNYYNGTYIFNESLGSLPSGWTDLSIGVGIVQVLNYSINKHYGLLSLETINVDDARIEQVFDDGNQVSGSIELWFFTTDCTHTSYILLFDGALQCITFNIVADIMRIHDGVGWHTFDTIPYDDIWYHLRIDFDCVTDTSTFYINDYNEGTHNFGNVGNNINEIEFVNSGVVGSYDLVVDSVGYSFSSNYTLTENKYPNIQLIPTNILSSDKYEFNFKDNGIDYEYQDIDIYGWSTQQSPTYCFIDNPANHFYYSYPNEPFEFKNAIYTISRNAGSGILNNSLNLYMDDINITFGISYASIHPTNYNQHDFRVSITSIGGVEIIRLAFDTVWGSAGHSNDRVDILYWDGVVYQFIERIYNIETYDLFGFNLYLNDFDVDLMYYRNDIYNNTFSIPYIIDRNGIDSLSLLHYDTIDDASQQFIRICYVGIYQHNISQSLEYGSLRYSFNQSWDFNTFNLFNITSDLFCRITTTCYSVDSFRVEIKQLNNLSTFHNTYGYTIRNYVHLWLISNTSIIINNIDIIIEGIRMLEYYNNIYITEYTPSYSYTNVNQNESYFYEYNNELHYVLNLTTNSTTEGISTSFDINNRISDNSTFFLTGRETLTCYGNVLLALFYRGMTYPSLMFLETQTERHSETLPFSRLITRLTFISGDVGSNDTFTGFQYYGYFTDVMLIYHYVYYPPYSELTITTLSLISVMIPLILILAPTFLIHAVYRKKGAIIPMLLFFSIIAFFTDLIPFQIFFIIIIALGSGFFLQYKNQKE